MYYPSSPNQTNIDLQYGWIMFSTDKLFMSYHTWQMTTLYLPNCNFIMLDVGDVLLNIAYNKKLAKLKKKY